MSNVAQHLDQNNSHLFVIRYEDPILNDTEMEVTRLLEEQELLIQYEGGILPELEEDLSEIQTVLNIGSGPGTWAVEAASLFTDMKIIGIDANQRLVKFARSRTQRLDNVRFLVMDVTKELDFPDGNFDLVNAQYLQGSLNTTTWLPFAQECARVVRPEGIVRLTETVCTESNSEAFNRLTSLLPLALYRAGRSFTQNINSMGITPMLDHLLREANCQQIRHRPFTVDYSIGTKAYKNAVHHIRVTYSPPFLGNFFIKTGVVSAEDYQLIYDKAMRAMVAPGFCAASHFLTVSGKKMKDEENNKCFS